MKATGEDVENDLRVALMANECPVDGCDRDPGGKWICESCWRLIPAMARREINDAHNVMDAADRSLPSYASIAKRWWDLAAQGVAIVEQREAGR